MKWYKDLYQFWMNNLERNVKRISIGFGSFLIVVLTTCTTPFFLPALYGAGVSFGSMVIMSIFGKNGNGQTIKPTEPDKPEVLDSKELDTSIENVDERKPGI